MLKVQSRGRSAVSQLDNLFENHISDLSEVLYLPFIDKDMKLSQVVGKKLPRGSQSTGETVKGNKVYTMSHPSKNVSYYLVGDSGEVNTHLVLTPKVSKKTKQPISHKVEVVNANRESPGVHHLYHHLITKHNMIITSDRQSLGGFKIWEKLSKMKGINVHGFSKGKVYNVGVEHPSETHASADDILLARYEGEPGELADLKKAKNMTLVAHKINEEQEPKLGKIQRTPGGPKKFMVRVRDPDTGNIKTVRFGDPNLSIKRDDPVRRKSFRARHKCDQATDRTTPRYWSCRQWRASAKVEG